MWASGFLSGTVIKVYYLAGFQLEIVAAAPRPIKRNADVN